MIDLPLAGPAPVRVTSAWTRADRIGAVRCRLGRLRDRYRAAPGLYALGSPGPDSPACVSANYKLSFDLLRRALAGRHAWILVLDTKGINVWCAAGKGTFGTDELVARVASSRLAARVRHRDLVVPQLGAPGIDAHAVQLATGFRVSFGPVRADDLPAYLDAGMRATPAMREVRFGLADRAALVPMEVRTGVRAWLGFSLFALIYAGTTARGILFDAAWARGWPLVVLGAGSVLAGCVLTPLALPLVPGRAFTFKGWLVGAALTAALLHGAGLAARLDPWLTGASYAFFPAAAGFAAQQFTGASTFTSLSGVRKEIRVSAWFLGAAALATVAGLVVSKILSWSAS
jgi:acetyl-CoA decarbonylase/synthase complex subunit gamma